MALKNRQSEVIDIPDFWVAVPPGLSFFLLVLVLMMIAAGTNLAIVFGVPNSIYLTTSAEVIYFSCVSLTLAMCIPNILVVRGYNRFAIKLIQWQLAIYSCIPIPFIITEIGSVNVWVGLVALASSAIALYITSTVSYKIMPHYFEKLINWKKERDRLRSEIILKIKRSKNTRSPSS